MTAAFAWLDSLMQWFGAFFPRILIIKSTHGGVKFIRGRRIKGIGPGLHLYWPMTTIVEVLPVVRQTMELTRQTITTADHVSVSVATIIIFTIDDIVTALTTTDDVRDTVYDLAKSAVLEVIGDMPFATIIKESKAVNKELSKKIRHSLKSYGLTVQNAFIVNFTRTLSITLEQ